MPHHCPPKRHLVQFAVGVSVLAACSSSPAASDDTPTSIPEPTATVIEPATTIGPDSSDPATGATASTEPSTTRATAGAPATVPAANTASTTQSAATDSPSDAILTEDAFDCLYAYRPEPGATYEYRITAAQGFTVNETVTVTGVTRSAEGLRVTSVRTGADLEPLTQVDICQSNGRLLSTGALRPDGSEWADIPRAELPAPDEPDGAAISTSAVVSTDFGDATYTIVTEGVSLRDTTVPAGAFPTRIVRSVQSLDVPADYTATLEFALAEIGLVTATFSDEQGTHLTELVSYAPGQSPLD